MPLIRRVPKRGFTNDFRIEYAVVNVGELEGLGKEVTPELLVEKGLVRARRRIKVLATGEIGSPLTVAAHKFSAAAKAKIEAAGGRCEELP